MEIWLESSGQTVQRKKTPTTLNAISGSLELWEEIKIDDVTFIV